MMFNFFFYNQFVTVSLIHVWMEGFAHRMSTDTSHVVVLQDSLAIAVNINEEIWKIPETSRFKAMNIYEFKFSANRRLFCSQFFRILLCCYFPISLSPNSQRKMCLIQQQIEKKKACCTKIIVWVHRGWRGVSNPFVSQTERYSLKQGYIWVNNRKNIYRTRPSIGRWFKFRIKLLLWIQKR